MTYESWQDLIERLQEKFPGSRTGKEELPEGPGHREFLEAATLAGKVRLELWVRPVVLEKKTLYSHRMNTAATVQYRYDESQHTLTLKAYRWDEAAGDWAELDPKALAGF